MPPLNTEACLIAYLKLVNRRDYRPYMQGEYFLWSSYNETYNCCRIWPAVLRQSTYGTIKFGTYYSLKHIIMERNAGHESVYVNICCAVIAGAVSSAIANPTDVLKVRMQVQGSHGNFGLMGCFKDVYTQEGISGLWKVP